MLESPSSEQYMSLKALISIKREANFLLNELFFFYHSASSVVFSMKLCIADYLYMNQGQTRQHGNMCHVSLCILLLFEITIQPFYFYILLLRFLQISFQRWSSFSEVLDNDQWHELIRVLVNMFENNSVNINN